MSTLTLDDLRHALATGAALRARLTLQPAGGAGTKVFPPTYVGDDNRSHGETRYATETRRIAGEDVACVLLDSVASQANRMELALLDAWEDGDLHFPLVRVDFSDADAELESPVGQISALEAPHRIYDAILRDSVDADGTLFRYTAAGRAITGATVRDASALYVYCPTALIFGAWDSTGPKGGLGSKFQRLLASEIVGIGMRTGTRVGGRLDPLGINKKAGGIYASDSGAWTDEKPAKKPKALNPSDVNHGNIAPSRSTDSGGVTFDHAEQTTVLSIPALRRLRFRTGSDGTPLGDPKAAQASARAALAALALAGVSGAYAAGHDLRSGTLLVGTTPLTLELVGGTGSVASTWSLDPTAAHALVAEAQEAAAALGLGWTRDPIPPLRPAPKLVGLLERSQALEATEVPQAEAT